MEDDILIAPAPYADPSAYYFPSFARMQGVEVLKGTSQIKHGPYTIGGAINLLSTEIPKSFEGFAQLSYGSFGTNQQRVWVGDSKNNIDYMFEFNRIASNGFKELPIAANTGFDRRDIMGKINWRFAQNTKVPQSLTLKYVNTTETANESYLGLTFDDFNKNPYQKYAATQKDLLELKHQHVALFHKITFIEKLKINTTVYYNTTFRDWGRVNAVGGGKQAVLNVLANPTSTLYSNSYAIMMGKANDEIVYQGASRFYSSYGIQTNLNYDFEIGAIKNNIQVGFRYHQDVADRYATQTTYSMVNQQMILTTPGVKGNAENRIQEAQALAAYMQYDVKYKNLTITPGIRFEQIKFNFQNFGNSDVTRLKTNLLTAKNDLKILLTGISSNYKINETMNAFAGVHQGFSPPGMPSTNPIITSQAKAETALNYEMGYRVNSESFKLQMVGFLSNYDNILGSDNLSSGGLGTGNMFNAGHSIIQGIELSAVYNLMNTINKESAFKIPLSLVYTFTDAKFKDTFVNAGGDWALLIKTI